MAKLLRIADFINQLRLLPRFMLLMITFMTYDVTAWAMSLGDTITTQQTALVSVIVTAFTGLFSVWLNNEMKKD